MGTASRAKTRIVWGSSHWNEYRSCTVNSLASSALCSILMIHSFRTVHLSPAMESLDDRSSAPNGERPLTDVPEGGKMRRIAAHTQGLFEDLREWIDLRIDLAILEVEERLDETKNEIALGLVIAIVGFFAALFTLTTIALGVGALLGHPGWGFLAVTVALFLIIGGLRVTQPALVPPSNLFESLRGERATASGEDERPPRPASAAVDEEETKPESPNVP